MVNASPHAGAEAIAPADLDDVIRARSHGAINIPHNLPQLVRIDDDLGRGRSTVTSITICFAAAAQRSDAIPASMAGMWIDS
jgi:hypothetical protein